MRKQLLSVAVTVFSIGLFAPIASAQTADSSVENGATVEYEDGSATHAAAAVFVEYEDDEVVGLSAASSFSSSAAAAAASPLGASSVGTTNPYGFIELPTSDSDDTDSLTVNFGSDIYDDKET